MRGLEAVGYVAAFLRRPVVVGARGLGVGVFGGAVVMVMGLLGFAGCEGAHCLSWWGGEGGCGCLGVYIYPVGIVYGALRMMGCGKQSLGRKGGMRERKDYGC